jgi:hypothetical protein
MVQIVRIIRNVRLAAQKRTIFSGGLPRTDRPNVRIAEITDKWIAGY